MLKYYNNMDKEKKINWREKARELALNPQDMWQFIEAFGNQLPELSPKLKERWDNMDYEEKFLRVLTLFKEMDERQNSN